MAYPSQFTSRFQRQILGRGAPNYFPQYTQASAPAGYPGVSQFGYGGQFSSGQYGQKMGGLAGPQFAPGGYLGGDVYGRGPQIYGGQPAGGIVGGRMSWQDLLRMMRYGGGQFHGWTLQSLGLPPNYFQLMQQRQEREMRQKFLSNLTGQRPMF